MSTDEEKLLAILNMVEEAEEAKSPVDLDQKQRATLQRILDAELPSPEEIIREAKIDEQNDSVQKIREANLARRRARRRAKLKKYGKTPKKKKKP